MFAKRSVTMANPSFVETKIKKFNVALNDLLDTDKNLAISASAISALLLIVRYASWTNIALIVGAGYALAKYVPFIGNMSSYFVGPKEYEKRSTKSLEFTKQLNGLISLYRKSCNMGPAISRDPLFLNLLRTIVPYVINGEDLNPWKENNSSEISDEFHEILSQSPHYIKPPVNKPNPSVLDNVFGLFYKKDEPKPVETKSSEELLFQPEQVVGFVKQKLYAVKMG